MVKPVAPCKNCTGKYEACHSTCEGYLKYRSDLDDYNNLIKSNKSKENLVVGFSVSTAEKRRRRKL